MVVLHRVFFWCLLVSFFVAFIRGDRGRTQARTQKSSFAQQQKISLDGGCVSEGTVACHSKTPNSDPSIQCRLCETGWNAVVNMIDWKEKLKQKRLDFWVARFGEHLPVLTPGAQALLDDWNRGYVVDFMSKKVMVAPDNPGKDIWVFSATCAEVKETEYWFTETHVHHHEIDPHNVGPDDPNVFPLYLPVGVDLLLNNFGFNPEKPEEAPEGMSAFLYCPPAGSAIGEHPDLVPRH
eukprot:gnl/Spiro4/7696_TR4047_c0_g1_i1.p1 gnl/Spiro4/7696_TR4047_c0_g1~~gnl/Spiro4/7696_TR4047_c0_g1_i1.p1  ORF type:complete len:272 (+),score=41.70 gnl/Spiro4/7696_TR4047_c0_g1_i1:108-818(+)